MMDISGIKKSLPGAELSEVKPCTTAGKVQLHLLVAGRKDLMTKVLDINKLEKVIKGDKRFSSVKASAELGVVKATYGGAEISALASGRVVVKKAEDEKKAHELLENLAPLLKKSLF